MLPDLRGPAPLHHTLLNRLNKTGVTLQTLHPKHFDQGRIVDQTPEPGLDIPSLDHATPESLLQFVGPLGAEMLERNILTGAFAQEDEQRAMMTGKIPSSLRHAAKIQPEDRMIMWHDWTADEMELRDRVLGRTWSNDVRIAHGSQNSRVTFQGWKNKTHDFQELNRHHHSLFALGLDGPEDSSKQSTKLAIPIVVKDDPERRIFFKAANDTIASPEFITMEGKTKVQASSLHQNLIDHGVRISADPQMTTKDYPHSNTFGESFTNNVDSNRKSEVADSEVAADLEVESEFSRRHIDWTEWTIDDFLDPRNQVSVSDSGLLTPVAHALAEDATKEGSGPEQAVFVFKSWGNCGRHYRTLVQRGGELYTPLPSQIPFGIGAPFYVSGDKDKRMMFWVWATPERKAMKIISPERIDLDGEVERSVLWNTFMKKQQKSNGEPGERRARLVMAEELLRFHQAK
ncbi:hypothetical protein AAFC00_004477 [Neodothiora populina]